MRDSITEEEVQYIRMIEHQLHHLPQHYSVLFVFPGNYGRVSFFYGGGKRECKITFQLNLSDNVFYLKPQIQMRTQQYDFIKDKWVDDYPGVKSIIPMSEEECREVKYFSVPFLQYLYSVLQ